MKLGHNIAISSLGSNNRRLLNSTTNAKRFAPTLGAQASSPALSLHAHSRPDDAHDDGDELVTICHTHSGLIKKRAGAGDLSRWTPVIVSTSIHFAEAPSGK